MDDVRAVMDAAGSERAALFGISEGGPMCSLFAATYPKRTTALVLYGTMARGMRDADYPWGSDDDQAIRFLDRIEREWGKGMTAKLFAPSIAQDEREVRSWAKFERRAVSPGGARVLIKMALDTDVRGVLPTIRVPTLVMHRAGDRATPVGGGRYIARQIPGAKYVEFDGIDHFPWVGDSHAVLGELEEFLTGVRHGPEPDRVLATVMFTDIVGSTEHAVALGDRRWRNMLDRYYAETRRYLKIFRGREVDTAGDGFAIIYLTQRVNRYSCQSGASNHTPVVGFYAQGLAKPNHEAGFRILEVFLEIGHALAEAGNLCVTLSLAFFLRHLERLPEQPPELARLTGPLSPVLFHRILSAATGCRTPLAPASAKADDWLKFEAPGSRWGPRLVWNLIVCVRPVHLDSHPGRAVGAGRSGRQYGQSDGGVLQANGRALRQAGRRRALEARRLGPFCMVIHHGPPSVCTCTMLHS